ncbi:MAG: signal recognition particle-docking protein FtsY [Clostridia bacterium]|nr:signal recognition particle-docking protein FtsY [Clostridia bacterium]
MAFLSKLFGKKDKDKKDDELLDYEELENEDSEEEGLTEEEIAAAERFEAENGAEFANATSLDYDGDFIDFDGDDDEESDEELVEIEDEQANEAEDAEAAESADESDESEELDVERDGDEDVEQLAEVSDEEDEQVLADVALIYEDASNEEEDTEEEEDDAEEEHISFWERLKNGLAKTKNALFGSVNEMLKSFVKVDEDLLEELEELLIMADVGVGATEEIIEELRDRIKDGRLKEKDQVLDTLKEILGDMIGEHQPLKLETTPSVVLVIGVNGAGKTTSIGKISKRLRLSGKKVVVAAADTFRAAAIDQLEVWCKRAKVDIVKQNEGSDPAAVVFDAINYVKKKEADVLIIDTAGRLHNKQNLMNELAKINRVIERELPEASRENLLVLDATTGQNAVIQAKEFSKAASITGITLNKLDGTAKGGIVISIKRELGIPVKFIGVGEKIDDMQEFDAKEFIDALFE